MAVQLNPRAERLLARLPRVTVYSALELLLLLLIAIQCARLFWGMMVPLGPVGDYKALDQMRAAAPAGASLGAFDPFFRNAQAGQQGPATVTTLEIRLFGISSNQATGGGSAIIGNAAGEQRSYSVGEEIMPGVTLVGVGFDFVTISRNGANEQLYLDQTPSGAPGASQPPMGAPMPQPMAVPPSPPPIVTVPAQPAPTPPAPTLQVNQ